LLFARVLAAPPGLANAVVYVSSAAAASGELYRSAFAPFSITARAAVPCGAIDAAAWYALFNPAASP
jgi:hypothetical protein